MRAETFSVARNYAESLFGLARAEDSLEKIEDDLFHLKTLLAANSNIKEFLNDQTISYEGKKKALAEILDGKVSAILRNFLNLIVDQGRQNLIFDIIEGFFLVSSSARGKITAEVISAIPLTEEMNERLRKELTLVAGKEVIVRASVDEKIIGGLFVRLGEKVIDGSVRFKLAELRKELVVSN